MIWPNGREALARATPIAAAASAPNPRASVSGWAGGAATSAVCTTLPSLAVWYWFTSRWWASSWARPSLGVPAKPLDAAAVLHLGLGVDQRGDGRVAPHLVQVAAAVRADAADRDAQAGADVGVGQRRVGDEQGDQLLAVRRQLVERLA